MKFTIIEDDYRHEDDLLDSGLFQLTSTLRWKGDIKWGLEEVERLRRNGAEAELGILNKTTKGKTAYAVFRDYAYEKRCRKEGDE